MKKQVLVEGRRGRARKVALRGGAAVAAAVAALAGGQDARAQAAPTPADAASGAAPASGDKPVQVIVLGSRARVRTVFDSPVPVDTLAGPQLSQALQDLAPSINLPRVSASGTSDTVRVVQLRGLAPDETLVLVNGKRRHANAVMDTEGLFPGTVSVDLNTIPAAAISGIEVLRDGAGAQYGSDAIAGVVDFRLKDADSGGSASLSLGENLTRFAPTGRRISDGGTLTAGADAGYKLRRGGFLRIGGDLQRRAGTNRSGPTDASIASWNDTAADQALDGRIVFKSGDPDQHGGDLFYNAGLPLGDGLQAYSFATFSHRFSRGGAFFRYPGDPGNVAQVYPTGYRPVTTGDDTDLSWVGGLKLSRGDWDLDGSLRIGQNEFDYGVEHSLNASLGTASPTAFHLADFKSRQVSLNADASRELAASFLAEPATLSLGAEAMRENYWSRPGDPASYAAGPDTSAPPGAQAGPGLRPQDAVSLARTVGSTYAELDLPLTKALRTDVAGRYSSYGSGGHATTGKLAARYLVGQDFLVRGAISNSFRAPALAQTGFRFATLNFNADGTGLQNNALLPATDPLARAFGAQSLKPETSTNLSLGAAWHSGSQTLTVDAYRIRIHDRITRSSDLQSDAASAYLASTGHADIGSVAFLTNALDTTTQGLDIVGSQQVKLPGSTLDLSLAANFNRTRIDRVRNGSAQLAAIDPSLTLLDPSALLVISRGSPRSKFVFGADWRAGAWGTVLRVTRFGSVYDRSFDENAPVVDGASAQRFGAKVETDLEVSYRATEHLTLAVGGYDVFDRYPDRTYAGSTLGGALPYDYVDPIGINGAFYYARVALAF